MSEHDGPSASREMESTRIPVGPGAAVGDFLLEELLGRGGMGEVWKAFDKIGDRYVVLKFLPAELQQSTGEIERIKQTFQHVHALHHQHICPVYSLGRHPDAGYFLVMKFLDGVTLSDFWSTKRPEDMARRLASVVERLRPVAEALDYAHSRKVIHRDVKPANVVVSRDGCDVQLVDFGLADEIRSSMTRISNVRIDVSGTRPYMAPEQWRGQIQNGATDQYALAVVAYELLSGHPPFVGSDDSVLLNCVLNVPPEPIAGLPESVNWALQKALGKSRNERFQTCSQMIEALTEGIRTVPLPTFSYDNGENRHLAPTVISSSAAEATSELAKGVRNTVARSQERLRRKKLIDALITLQRAQRAVAGGTRKLRLIGWMVLLAFCAIWWPTAIYNSLSNNLRFDDPGSVRKKVEKLYPGATYQQDRDAYFRKVDGNNVRDEMITTEYRKMDADYAGKQKKVRDYNSKLQWGVMALGVVMVATGSVTIILMRRSSLRRALQRCKSIPQDLTRDYPEESEAWGGADALSQPHIIRELIESLRSAR